MFSVFKQYFTYFYTLFYSHMFLNNNFQFLSTSTKHSLNFYNVLLQVKRVRKKKKESRERSKKKKKPLFWSEIVCLCQMINLMVLLTINWSFICIQIDLTELANEQQRDWLSASLDCTEIHLCLCLRFKQWVPCIVHGTRKYGIW